MIMPTTAPEAKVSALIAVIPDAAPNRSVMIPDGLAQVSPKAMDAQRTRPPRGVRGTRNCRKLPCT